MMIEDARARLRAKLDETGALYTADFTDNDWSRLFEVIESIYDPRDERDILLERLRAIERLRATTSGKDINTLGMSLVDLRAIVERAEQPSIIQGEDAGTGPDPG